jgi:hypothetical protein
MILGMGISINISSSNCGINIGPASMIFVVDRRVIYLVNL